MYIADYERDILSNQSRVKRMIIPFPHKNFLVNRRKQSLHSMRDWRSTDEYGPLGVVRRFYWRQFVTYKQYGTLQLGSITPFSVEHIYIRSISPNI